VNVDSSLNAISLFSGGAGLDLGIRMAVPGCRVVAYVEREAYACEVLASRMEEGRLDSAPIWTDVTTFDGKPFSGLVDLVFGGFPCQDISVAGKRAGIDGERSGLWSEFARIVREVGPSYVFVENVAALLVRGIDRVLGDLAALGFDAEWEIVSAADAGAVHLRERVFILAHARRLGIDGLQPIGLAERSRSPVLGGGSETLGYANGARRQGAWRDDGSRPGTGGNALADTDGHGLQGSDVLQQRRPGIRGGSSESVPFPPGPDDSEAWRRYLEEHPSLEPALRRGADGMANRLDRLRLLGNGVVPQQAALALGELAARIGG
jgi:DNA (cytosine-5)-methyltransferase 1